jgi:uncharacterized protein YdeI (YjbR/CyaY-like superfamily)
LLWLDRWAKASAQRSILAPEIYSPLGQERLVEDKSGQSACPDQAKKMKPAGLKEIERAKLDGRWDAAYDSSSKATVPDDFQSALDGNAQAKAFFGTLDSRNRYAVLFRIQTARKAETRAKRISQFVLMLERHEKVHP